MKTGIVWFRFDLRLTDNAALTNALQAVDQIVPLFILEEGNESPSSLGGAQRWWLYHSLKALDESLESQLVLRTGNCLAVLKSVIQETQATHVFWNRHYEPYTIQRDQHIKSTLQEEGIEVNSFSGYLLTEPSKIKNSQGGPFKVFTPFWKHCRAQLQLTSIIPAPSKLSIVNNIRSEHLKELNLLSNLNWADEFSKYWQCGEQGALQKLSEFLDEGIYYYHGGRDLPAQQNTSRLSPHLHFGEISPKQVWHAIHEVALSKKINQKCIDTFLSQLGWREFSYHLLYQFPTLPEQNFRQEFDKFPWHHNPEHLRAWQQGKTGFPIVDAGMRELWITGTMHNRVRMIVASFLIKDLFIDWRMGERWFWDTLLDADLANNSASWQWVAGSGADAAPYFRIFNPVLQGQKFDPDGEYVRRWVGELANVDTKYIHTPWESPHPPKNYPAPIVDHGKQRQLALDYYQKIKNQQ